MGTYSIMQIIEILYKKNIRHQNIIVYPYNAWRKNSRVETFYPFFSIYSGTHTKARSKSAKLLGAHRYGRVDTAEPP